MSLARGVGPSCLVASRLLEGPGKQHLSTRSKKILMHGSRLSFSLQQKKSLNLTVPFSLQDRKAKDWGSAVQLIFGDMRRVDLPEKVDILVSELLGSFGDNELSPECLDGAMRFLKRKYARPLLTREFTLTIHLANGISIPCSYTAYLAPLSSSKLYNAARESRELKGVETPYVVMFQNVNILSGDGGGVGHRCGPKIQECWDFEHPGRDVAVDDKG